MAIQIINQDIETVECDMEYVLSSQKLVPRNQYDHSIYLSGKIQPISIMLLKYIQWSIFKIQAALGVIYTSHIITQRLDRQPFN